MRKNDTGVITMPNHIANSKDENYRKEHQYLMMIVGMVKKNLNIQYLSEDCLNKILEVLMCAREAHIKIANDVMIKIASLIVTNATIEKDSKLAINEIVCYIKNQVKANVPASIFKFVKTTAKNVKGVANNPDVLDVVAFLIKVTETVVAQQQSQ